MRQLQLAQAVAVFQFTLENGAVMHLTDATYFGASAFRLKVNLARRHSQGGFVVQWDAFLAQVLRVNSTLRSPGAPRYRPLRILAPP